MFGTLIIDSDDSTRSSGKQLAHRHDVWFLGLPDGPAGILTVIAPMDTVRLVTNDFMFSGGDGYTILSSGVDLLIPGHTLLDISIDYVTANSPVAPVIEGRIVGP